MQIEQHNGRQPSDQQRTGNIGQQHHQPWLHAVAQRAAEDHGASARDAIRRQDDTEIAGRAAARKHKPRQRDRVEHVADRRN